MLRYVMVYNVGTVQCSVASSVHDGHDVLGEDGVGRVQRLDVRQGSGRELMD